jgi:hypothetical protein
MSRTLRPLAAFAIGEALERAGDQEWGVWSVAD